MARMLKLSGLRALLAAPLFHLISASPQAATVTPAPSVTAVSSCHLHDSTQYCEAGTVEYRISGAAATASSYTNCHAHGSQTYCEAPTGEVQIILALETGVDHVVTHTSSAAVSPASVTAVSECHMHETQVVCMAGATEYVVHITPTGTTDIPPQFTGCHGHGTETFCESPDGEEVAISLASDNADHDDHAEESGLKCHFHAGVEHCVDASGAEVEKTCEKVDRNYNIPLRVGLLFVIMVTSSIGVFTPILISSFVSPTNPVFTILRQFGTGIIISTAFIHLFTHAVLMFQNDCLGELAYESTASAILMAGIFLSFLVEYLGIRLVQWHGAKRGSEGVESPSGTKKSPHISTEMVNITVLEAGVIFHSLLIGLTLVVAADTFFLTLFAVIVFHQMFEGIALGTRIAALGHPGSVNHSHGHSHGPGHHGHFHEPKQPSPSTLAEELVAASDHHHTQAAGATAGKGSDIGSGNESDGNAAAKHAHHAVSMKKKLLLAGAFALVTPVGMAIGIGALRSFNGNDPSTIIAIGTLDALSAGILVWVGVVEMWAHDWMLGGEMTTAGPVRTVLGMVALIAGMVLMNTENMKLLGVFPCFLLPAAAAVIQALLQHFPETSQVGPLQTRKDHPEYCTNYTWTEKTTESSPLLEDCIMMMRTVQYGAKWKVLSVDMRTIADHKTCHFGVQQNTRVTHPFRISHRDLLNLVNPALWRFQKDGRAGAEGYMKCEKNYAAGEISVFWSLF
ncbi:hypothetical protein OQA88_3513 [Cercophora sp. LCS_1]